MSYRKALTCTIFKYICRELSDRRKMRQEKSGHTPLNKNSRQDHYQQTRKMRSNSEDFRYRFLGKVAPNNSQEHPIKQRQLVDIWSLSESSCMRPNKKPVLSVIFSFSESNLEGTKAASPR